MVKLAILLRGHIRDSFTNTAIKDCMIKLIEIFGNNNCDIFIHTWNKTEANKSWRVLNTIPTVVTENIILNYFAPIVKNIKHIIIDDDTKINLKGNIQGKMFNTKCPKLGWKNMWYGNYKICKYVHDNYLNNYKLCLNCRLDIFSVKFTPRLGITIQTIIDKIATLIRLNNIPITFFRKQAEFYGIDNIYFGTLVDLYKLATTFNYNLDKIQENYLRVRHQEYVLPYVASDLKLTANTIIPLFHIKQRIITLKGNPNNKIDIKIPPPLRNLNSLTHVAHINTVKRYPPVIPNHKRKPHKSKVKMPLKR